jgi:hypothetical protein
MSDYLDVSVLERDSTQGHRENANAINYLLESISVLAAFMREKAYLFGLTPPDNILDNAVIDNWDNAETQGPESLIDANALTGIFTIGSPVPGSYKLDGNFIGLVTGNNVSHRIVVETSIASGVWAQVGVIGVALSTNQANEVSLSGFGFSTQQLVAGDRIRLVHSSSSGVDTFTTSVAQVSLELIAI